MDENVSFEGVMANSMSDFERFLYANYPDDYRRATADDVPDDVINAILSKHERHYQIWRRIPEWIKDVYRDVIPTEVLNGNEPVRDFIEDEQQKLANEEKETQQLFNYSINLLALGYAAETVAVMVENRQKRQELLAAAHGAPLSEEQMKLWLQTRESDQQAIQKDWRENHAEKFIVHLFKEIDREKRRMARNGESVDSALKISRMENEAAQLLARFSDMDKKKAMVGYLREQPQQAALKHMNPEVRQRLVDMLRKNGIAVEDKNFAQVNRENLAQSLKRNFDDCRKRESILCSKYQYQNQTFDRVSARQVLEQAQNLNINTLVAARRAGRQETSA